MDRFPLSLVESCQGQWYIAAILQGLTGLLEELVGLVFVYYDWVIPQHQYAISSVEEEEEEDEEKEEEEEEEEEEVRRRRRRKRRRRRVLPHFI